MNPLGDHDKSDETGDQEKPAWIHQGQIVIETLDHPLWQSNFLCSCDEIDKCIAV